MLRAERSASEAFSWKWGFRGEVETFRREASDKFSLLKDGTLDKPHCARLLLVNVSSGKILALVIMLIVMSLGCRRRGIPYRRLLFVPSARITKRDKVSNPMVEMSSILKIV